MGFPVRGVTTVIFDVDGTLIDSNAAHAESWARALTEHGIPRDAVRIRPLIGLGSDKLLPTLGLEEGSPLGRAVAERKQELFDEQRPHLRPTRGARALVSFLREQGTTLIVATSGGDEEMDALLDQAGVSDLMPERTSRDDAARSKPDPDIVLASMKRSGARPQASVMIGDTPYDIASARGAGIPLLAVRCGGHWSDRDLGAAIAIFDDPADLLQHWRASMTTPTRDDGDVVPIPGQDNEAERRRIRQSNDRDQEAERQGQQPPHNRGYDEAADGTTRLPINPVDEE